MNNPYCASFEKVRDLYVEHTKALSRKHYDEMTKDLSREEIKRQLDTKTGSLMDSTRSMIRRITKDTEFVEFLAAVQLADFHFPNEAKSICFELKRSARPSDIKTYRDLVDNIENNTYIDCQIKTQSKKISFQIKRDGSDHTPEGFAQWLNDKVLKKYSNMSGTSLVIFLGMPHDGSQINLDRFYEEFVKTCKPNNSFDEVCIMYNDATTDHIVLHDFFPKQRKCLIEAELAMARFRGDA